MSICLGWFHDLQLFFRFLWVVIIIIIKSRSQDGFRWFSLSLSLSLSLSHSLSVSVVYCSRQVFQTTSCVRTELMLISSCWSANTISSISDVLLWTPTYGWAKAGRPARTYIQQLWREVAREGQGYPCLWHDMMMRMMISSTRRGYIQIICTQLYVCKYSCLIQIIIWFHLIISIYW